MRRFQTAEINHDLVKNRGGIGNKASTTSDEQPIPHKLQR